MNSQQILKLVSKQWCNLSDLMKLLNCGRNKALVVKNQIKNKLLEDGYIIPNYYLPMKAVVDILKIDLDYLEKVSKYN